jgi:plasmid maintenance system antidote protein VapI
MPSPVYLFADMPGVDISALANLGGCLAVCVVFVYYLIGRDKSASEKDAQHQEQVGTIVSENQEKLSEKDKLHQKQVSEIVEQSQKQVGEIVERNQKHVDGMAAQFSETIRQINLSVKAMADSNLQVTRETVSASIHLRASVDALRDELRDKRKSNNE